MFANPSALDELLSLVTRLRTQEAELRAQYEGRLAELRGQVAAVQTTIDLLGHAQSAGESRRSEAPPPVPTNNWGKKLAGLKQLDALKVIAQENGGILRITEVRPIFISHGLSKGDPRHVYGHIYHILSDSDEFEFMGKGTGSFRLKDEQQPEPADAPAPLFARDEEAN